MAKPAARNGGRSLTVFDPSQEFEDIYDRMGQLMGLALGEPSTASPALAWTPAADVSETDDSYVIELDLPGVRKKDIDIQMIDKQFIVSGELTRTEREHLRRRTRKTGRFEYRVALPGDVDADEVNAKLSDGVLTVTVPKATAAEPRHVEIKD